MSALIQPKLVHPIELDGFKLALSRFGGNGKRGAVLLVHGASANSATFLVPEGGLAAALIARDFEVWTLDWRGSSRVVESLPLPVARGEYCRFTLDHAGREDIPQALAAMRALRASMPISIVAHCFGAGACAVAIAQGNVPDVQNVVLLTLGLFYEVPWDGWVKAEDFILERILGRTDPCRAIDPREPVESWPPDLRDAIRAYPEVWLPAPGDGADEILRRLAFMFGAPYPREMLASGIHGPRLSELFGPMHLGLYLHAGQMVRRGYAAPFGELDIFDRHRLPEPRRPRNTYLVPGPFADKRITLITGAENRLWHRDSIDLMYEWLRAEARPGRRSVKHVLRGYAHQDLLWGERAAADVYPLIAEGLGA
jgi:cholesterol oxidase